MVFFTPNKRHIIERKQVLYSMFVFIVLWIIRDDLLYIPFTKSFVWIIIIGFAFEAHVSFGFAIYLHMFFKHRRVLYKGMDDMKLMQHPIEENNAENPFGIDGAISLKTTDQSSRKWIITFGCVAFAILMLSVYSLNIITTWIFQWESDLYLWIARSLIISILFGLIFKAWAFLQAFSDQFSPFPLSSSTTTTFPAILDRMSSLELNNGDVYKIDQIATAFMPFLIPDQKNCEREWMDLMHRIMPFKKMGRIKTFLFRFKRRKSKYLPHGEDPFAKHPCYKFYKDVQHFFEVGDINKLNLEDYRMHLALSYFGEWKYTPYDTKDPSAASFTWNKGNMVWKRMKKGLESFIKIPLLGSIIGLFFTYFSPWTNIEDIFSFGTDVITALIFYLDFFF